MLKLGRRDSPDPISSTFRNEWVPRVLTGRATSPGEEDTEVAAVDVVECRPEQSEGEDVTEEVVIVS